MSKKSSTTATNSSSTSTLSTIQKNNENMEVGGGKQVNPKPLPSEKIKVVIRCRPLSQKENDEKCSLAVKVSQGAGEIEVLRPINSNNSSTANPERKLFVFDSVYDSRNTQGEIYEESFRPLITSVLEGINGTIFAYGQTGTGKTWTMQGNLTKSEDHGVIPNAFKTIFDHISNSPDKRYLVRASYLEIYQEEIRDLLHKEKRHRELKEGPEGTYVKELSSYLCSNFQEINDLMTKGNKNRAVGSTNMNEHSSRSHAIFMITIEVSEEWKDGGASRIRVGKLNLVDLAGSERQTKSGATGERLKEATKINLSLSALGNVINALQDGKSTHIPYRDSKLTRILQDSLGGNARTVMVATIGPADYNLDETTQTLRYASRAKRIKNRPKVNEDPKDAMLREYQEEIARLREQLAQKRLIFKVDTPNEMSGMSDTTSAGGGGRRNKSRGGTAKNGTGKNKLGGSERDEKLRELRSLLEPYGLDPNEEDPVEILSLLEERKLSLLEDDATVKEEKDSLLARLNELQSSLQNSETECDNLSERINWLESKVLNGGKSLRDHTNEQKQILEQKQLELNKQIQREELIRRKLEEHELTASEIKSALLSTQSDFESKSKKLRKLCHRLNSTRAEFQKIQAEFIIKRQDMEKDQIEVNRELKLMRMIIDQFVPPSIKKLTENRIRLKENGEDYYLLPVEANHFKRPPAHRQTSLPMFNRGGGHDNLNGFSANVQSLDGVHFRDQNILQLHPEQQTTSIKNFTQANSDPFVKALLEKSYLDIDQEIVIDCRKLTKKKGRKESQNTHGIDGEREYSLVGLGSNKFNHEINTWKSGGVEFRDIVSANKSQKNDY